MQKYTPRQALVKLKAWLNGGLEGFTADTRGLTTVEYVIVLALIAMIAIGTWGEFGEAVEKHVDGARVNIEAMGE